MSLSKKKIEVQNFFIFGLPLSIIDECTGSLKCATSPIALKLHKVVTLAVVSNFEHLFDWKRRSSRENRRFANIYGLTGF